MGTRSLGFRQQGHNRFWWHRTQITDYVPIPYSFLSDSEWDLMRTWFDDTGVRYSNPGEANVPPLSLLIGLISGNAIHRIVQCGHFAGYSTLLLGFLLRQMGHKSSLYSIDIDQAVTAYTAGWVKRAGLDEYVHLEVSDSAQPELPARATRYFGGRTPQLVFIDSSHQYAHTIEELDLWYPPLPQGGLIALHDASRFAAAFDSTGQGGVFRAVSEWCAVNGVPSLMLNSFVEGGTPGDYPCLDGCGLAIIQKNRA